jgi:beta-lactamase class D
MRIVFLILVFMFETITCCFGQQIQAPSLGGYDTALIIYDCSSGDIFNINPLLSSRRLPPCSTFKIYNALIGLELGLVKSADDPWYDWDGVKRDIEGWNRDLTLREAFQVSAVPAFQNLARQIGPERMKDYIDKIGYGSKNISAGVDVFWLPRPDTQPILISADEQVELLKKLLDKELPFSEKNIQILRDIMQIERSDKGILYGKTGSGMGEDGNWNLGWFVGFAESGGKRYIFACNMTGGDNPFGKTAQAFVKNVLISKGIF